MATTDTAEPLIINTDDDTPDSTNQFNLSVRKIRLSFWCLIFWIYAIASLTATSLLLENQTDDDTKTVERLYIAGDSMFLIGVMLTVIHLYLTEIAAFRVIGGFMFMLGGILHIAATSKFVHVFCVHNIVIDNFYPSLEWCRVQAFGNDFMAEYLSIFIGIDIVTYIFDQRILRLIGYNLILSVCCLIIGSYINSDINLNDNFDTHTTRTDESAFLITGLLTGVLFVVLLVIQILNNEINHNETVRYAQLFVGLILVTGAGLMFFSLLPGYQMLLVITSTVVIALEFQYI